MKYKVLYHIGKKTVETEGRATVHELYKRARIVLLLRDDEGQINGGKFFLHQILK